MILHNRNKTKAEALSLSVSDANKDTIYFTTDNLGIVMKGQSYCDSVTKASQDAKGNVIDTTYATKSELDTKISNLIGGASKDYDTLKEIEDWVTKHQDLYQGLVSTVGSKASTSYVDTELAKKADKTTVTDLTTVVNNKADKTSIADMATQSWVNGKNYLTSASLAGYAKTSDIPTNVSSFNNDVPYLTQHQSLSNYYTKSEVDTKISSAGSSYTLPIANAITLGGVKSTKTGTTPNRNYAVEVNADGTMTVNVPWEAGTSTTAPSYTGGTGIAVSGASIALKKIKPSFSQTPSALSIGIADEDGTLITSPLVTVPNATDNAPGVVSLSTINSQMSSRLGLALSYSGGSTALLTLKTDGTGEATVSIPVGSSSSGSTGGDTNVIEVIATPDGNLTVASGRKVTIPAAETSKYGLVTLTQIQTTANSAANSAAQSAVNTAFENKVASTSAYGVVKLADSITNNSSTVPTTKAVYDAIQGLSGPSGGDSTTYTQGNGISILANKISVDFDIEATPNSASGSGFSIYSSSTGSKNVIASYNIPAVNDNITNIPGVISIDKVKSIVSESNASVSINGQAPGNDAGNVTWKVSGNGINADLNIPHAKTNSPGLVRLGYSDSGTNYGVKMDDNGRIYVTVPNTGGYTAGSGINVASGSIGLNLKATYTQTATSCGLAINDGTSNAEIVSVEFPLASSAAVAGMMTKAQATKLDGISTASETKAGLIRTNYTTSGNNYAVKVNGSGDAYVTVPTSGGSDDKTYVAPYYLSADSLKSSSSSDSYIAGVMSNINSGKIAYVQATRSDSTLIKLNPYDSTSFTYEYEGTTYKVVVSGNGYTTTKLIDRSNSGDGLVVGSTSDRYVILQCSEGSAMVRDSSGNTSTLLTSDTLYKKDSNDKGIIYKSSTTLEAIKNKTASNDSLRALGEALCTYDIVLMPTESVGNTGYVQVIPSTCYKAGSFIKYIASIIEATSTEINLYSMDVESASSSSMTFKLSKGSLRTEEVR